MARLDVLTRKGEKVVVSYEGFPLFSMTMENDDLIVLMDAAITGAIESAIDFIIDYDPDHLEIKVYDEEGRERPADELIAYIRDKVK